MSSLDGCARIADIVKTVASRGNPAVAVTDHGTLRGAYLLTEECKKSKIKPIYGIEFYAVPEWGEKEPEPTKTDEGSDREALKLISEDEEPKAEDKSALRKMFHLTAWALNQEGLKNLFRLSSKAWLEGFYYRPRIDFKNLEKYSSGIAVGTGCVGSIVNRHLVEERPRIADTTLGWLDRVFEDRLYFEIMPHVTESQKKINEFIHVASSFKPLNLIATQDAHYLTSLDAESHDVLLTIGSHKRLGDPDRLQFPTDSYWLMSRSEIELAFEDHPWLSPKEIQNACDNTVAFAERCSALIEIDPLKNLLPKVELPQEFESEFAYLVYLVKEGMRLRDVELRAERYAESKGVDYSVALEVYVSRMKRELRTLKASGFISYFLVIWDMYRWSTSQGIARGPGRGSAAGSLVAFLLGITNVDPIEHRLMFERFIAPGRINMPDIDCDFQDDRRGEVLEYLRQKYGSDRVAQISTVGRMNGRQALKDVARVYEVPIKQAQVAASMISQEIEEGAIEKAFETGAKVLQQFREEYPDVVKHAQCLEGISKSLGVHPAGVVISPIPLSDVVPLETRGKNHDQVVTAFDMRGVEGLGLLKIDVLGLKAVAMLEDARSMVETTGVKCVLEQIPLDDREVLEKFTKRDFLGIFQFDTSSSHSVCDGMRFVTFDDIAAVNAINRPGAIDFADEFKRRRAMPSLKSRDVFHPMVTEITADSLGLMIYQEHVVRVATDVAGFTPEHADKLRKKIGKSEGAEALEEDRDEFVLGCSTNTPDMSRETANHLFDAIVKFGRYGFNRAHSVCYSLLAYWSMYFKCHFPLEFYCALLRKESDSSKIQRIVRDARDHGIEVKLPNVNVSSDRFMIDRGTRTIRGSLLEIKGVGEAAILEIVRVREEGGLFQDFVDFLRRTHGRKVTKRTIEALVKGGAFDDLVPNTRWLVTDFERYWKYIEHKRYTDLSEAIRMSAHAWKWSEEDRLRSASLVNPLAMPPHPLIKWEPWIETNIKVPLSEISDDTFSKEGTIFVAGHVVEMETRYVGDSKIEDDVPSSRVQNIVGWGKPWIRFTLEGVSGARVWARIGWSQMDDYKEIVDKGIGGLLFLCARTRPQWRNLEIYYMADLEEIERKLSKQERLSIFERLFLSDFHPAMTYPWESKVDRRIAITEPEKLSEKSNGTLTVIGVVSHIYLNVDKTDSEMAYFSIAGKNGCVSVLSFSSSWQEFKGHLRVGTFAKFKLQRLDGGAFALNANPGAMTLLTKDSYDGKHSRS